MVAAKQQAELSTTVKKNQHIRSLLDTAQRDTFLVKYSCLTNCCHHTIAKMLVKARATAPHQNKNHRKNIIIESLSLLLCARVSLRNFPFLSYVYGIYAFTCRIQLNSRFFERKTTSSIIYTRIYMTTVAFWQTCQCVI